MRSAIDVRTKRRVDADDVGFADRHRVYRCPHCGARVHYKRSIGRSSEPIFAHNPGEASPDCEEYYPWEGYGPISSASSPAAPARAQVEDEPAEFGLCLEDGTPWNLYLRVPEITASELRNVSPLALTAAFIDVEAAGWRSSMPLVDLRSGSGAARLVVPPSAVAFRITTPGTWPAGLAQKRWQSSSHGLDPRGALFRLRHGEWVRLRPSSAIEFGEELRFVADQSNGPPAECNPQSRGIVTARKVTWRMWRVTIPDSALKRVESWAASLGFEIVEPAWDVVLATVPDAIDPEDGRFIYPRKAPIICRAQSARVAATVDVFLKAGSSRYSDTVSTPRSGDSTFLAISLPWPGSNELLVGYDDRTAVPFDSTDPPSLSEIRRVLSVVPVLRLKIADMVITPWGHSVDVTLPSAGDDTPLIEILPEIEGLRLSIEWNGEVRASRDRLTRDSAAKLLRSLLEDSRSVSVRLDAGALGSINFRLCSAAQNKASAVTGKSERVSIAWRLSATRDGVMLPAALIRNAVNSGGRLRAAVLKRGDPKYRALTVQKLREQMG